MLIKPRRKAGPRVRRIARRVVWAVVVCAGLWVLGVAYLNVFGVPEPLLRRIVQHLNASGVPVGIESLRLTRQGWHATEVKYFSPSPDDLQPLIQVSEIDLCRIRSLKERSPGRVFSVDARDARLSPSVEWGVEVSDDSVLRRIEQLDFIIGFGDDRISIRKGAADWSGLKVYVNGSVLISPEASGEPQKPGVLDMLPMILSPHVQGVIKNAFAVLEKSRSAVVNLDFLVDTVYPEATRASMSARVEKLQIREMSFSRAEMSADYDQSRFCLNSAALFHDNETFEISGSYDAASLQAEVRIENQISSQQMFSLLPAWLMAGLGEIGFSLDSCPVGDVQLGPALPVFLLRRISGSFSLQNVGFKGLQLDSLSGDISRTGSRLDLFNLKGIAQGQETRSAEVGSCMVGGSATGEVFWDSQEHRFGVIADGSLDPCLLLSPLSDVEIATNIISLFRFDSRPPVARVELGACYDDWRSFYFSVHGTAPDMRFRDVPFSSVSATVYYGEGVLTLDSVVAMQGIDYVKGNAALDFGRGIATFDGIGSVNPKAVEDVVSPRSRIFTDRVQVVGPAKINARGTVDWRHMRTTGFEAEVEAPKVELPFASLDHLKTTVTGTGPVIQVGDAAFGMCGGDGTGRLSILLDPSKKGVPYKVDVKIDKADFNQCISHMHSGSGMSAKGELFVTLQADADFSRSFFESANGKGRISIRNGQLADLPLFRAFSRVMRKLIPSFNVFSINRLSGDFELRDGVIFSDNAYFDGDLLSAKGRGSYSRKSGFDAYVQAQVLSDNNLSKILRFITDPLFKLFELKLEGAIGNPEWKLDTFSLENKTGNPRE